MIVFKSNLPDPFIKNKMSDMEKLPPPPNTTQEWMFTCVKSIKQGYLLTSRRTSVPPGTLAYLRSDNFSLVIFNARKL